MEAGIPALDVLDTMGKKKGWGQARIAAFHLRAGWKITDAIAKGCPKIPPHLLECIRAGESCGQIASQLAKAAESIEKNVEARRKALIAIAYPCTVTVLAIIVASGICLFAFPAIIGAAGTGKLPWVSQSLLSATNALKSYGIILVAVIGAGAAVLATRNGRKELRKVLEKTPFIGKMIRKAEAARISKALAQMLGAGVDVFQSLKLLKKIAQSPKLKKALGQAEKAIRNGATLTESLQNAGLPDRMVAALETGERTGKLDSTLAQAATLLEKEADRESALVLGAISQATLLVAGLLVGWVVIATYSAIFSLYTGLGK
jgi:type II secretory pathway component PulF